MSSGQRPQQESPTRGSPVSGAPRWDSTHRWVRRAEKGPGSSPSCDAAGCGRRAVTVTVLVLELGAPGKKCWEEGGGQRLEQHRLVCDLEKFRLGQARGIRCGCHTEVSGPSAWPTPQRGDRIPHGEVPFLRQSARHGVAHQPAERDARRPCLRRAVEVTGPPGWLFDIRLLKPLLLSGYVEWSKPRLLRRIAELEKVSGAPLCRGPLGAARVRGQRGRS